jgi:large subunit ribosomal protein L25
MDALPLTTEPRTGRGKSPNRQLRMQSKMPAVLYGPGFEPVALSVVPKELATALASPHRRNQLLSLRVANTDHLALIRELQVHPVTRVLLHVDFYRVDPEQPVDVTVPLKIEGRAKGVVDGGEVRVMFRDLPVRAKPTEIPVGITFDVSELNLGDVVSASALPVPAGVVVALDPERTVIACAMPRRQEEEEAAAEAAAAVPGAEGAAAAPGAEGAAPGAPAADAKAKPGDAKAKDKE